MNYVFLKRFSYNLFTKMLLLFRIFLIKTFHLQKSYASKILRGATIPVMLAKTQVKTISVHFIKKKLPSSKLYTACSQEKSCHKKNHADSEYFTCLLKKCSYLQHVSQSGHLQACKMSGFFFMVIFLVSSPKSTTTFRFQHS